jgi:acetyl esterase/lipase
MAPTFVLSGTEDPMYPQYPAFIRRLRDLNVIAELFTAEGVGHGGVNQPKWFEPSIKRVAEFLAQAMKQ